MITSLHISGFKLFRDLMIPRLGQLNLFVGANNTGKSCLLEAIGLYAGKAPINDVVQTASLRSAEVLKAWEINGVNELGTFVRHPIFDLFHGYGPGSKGSGSIVIEKIGDPAPLSIRCEFYENAVDEEGFRRYVPVSPGQVINDTLEIAVSVFRGDKQVGLVTRRHFPQRTRLLDSDMFSGSEAAVVAHVPACGFTDEKAASLWDALIQGPGQERVLEWLRMLDPRIESLDYIAGRLRSRIALLKIQGEGRIPLNSLGDGLRRLFHIGLAMANASRGILLIDEFETGLYWEVQKQLWQAMFEAAEKFNIQVFATTHSNDCISAFVEAQKVRLIAGENYVYRLERRGPDIRVHEFSEIGLEAAIRQGIEVR
jgi:AAA domain, putative AbiEii toxin, Type IV TA system